MKSLRTWMGRAARAAGLVMVLAVLVGLPLAVHMRTSLDVLYSGVLLMQRGGDAFVVSEPLVIGGAIAPIRLVRGTVWSSKPGITTTAEWVSKLYADGLKAEIDLTGAASPDGASAAPSAHLSPLLAQLANLHLGKLILHNADVDLTFSDTTVRLEAITAEVAAARGGRFTAKGLATYRGHRVSFEADWSTPSPGKGTPMPVRLEVRGTLLEAVIEGGMTVAPAFGFDGRATLQSARIRMLAKWLGGTLSPRLHVHHAAISGPVNIAEGRVTFPNAVVTIDNNKATGALSAIRKAGRLAIDTTLGFDRLDVSRYVSPNRLADMLSMTSVALVSGASARPTDAMLRQPLLTLFDADVRISAAKVLLPLVEAGRGAVTLALKKGKLLADLAELEIESGTAAGQLMLDVLGDGMRVAAKGKLTGIDPGRVLTHPLKRNPMLGRADMTFEMTSAGASLDEMIAAAAGKGSFAMTEAGGRLGLDLTALAYAAAHQQGGVGWAAAGRNGMPIERLTGRFSFTGGMLLLDAIEARSGAKAVSGSGSIDFNTQALDVGLTIGPAVASPDARSGTPETLRFQGNWAQPAITTTRQPPRTTWPTERTRGKAVAPAVLVPAAVAP